MHASILRKTRQDAFTSAVGNVPELGRGGMLCELGPGLNLTLQLRDFFGEHLVTESIGLAIPCGLMPSSIAALAVEGGQRALCCRQRSSSIPCLGSGQSHLPPISISGTAVQRFNNYWWILMLQVLRSAFGV